MGSQCHGDGAAVPMRRAVCARCVKPAKLCLCSRLRCPPLDNGVAVTVLQHSHEAKHPLNSTRIAKLGLRNISLVPVSDVNLHARLEMHPLIATPTDPTSSTSGDADGDGDAKSTEGIAEKATSKCQVLCSPASLTVTLQRTAKPNLDWVLQTALGKSLVTRGFRVRKLHAKKKTNSNSNSGMEEAEVHQVVEYDLIVPPNSVLLFPTKKSLALDSASASAGPLSLRVENLIVLDGTWGKAHRMYHENPWLQLLPHFKLDLHKQSLYSEVRHQPKSGCLSTIETIVFALKIFGEDSDSLDSILGVFESMILDQRRCKNDKFCH